MPRDIREGRMYSIEFGDVSCALRCSHFRVCYLVTQLIRGGDPFIASRPAASVQKVRNHHRRRDHRPKNGEGRTRHKPNHE